MGQRLLVLLIYGFLYRSFTDLGTLGDESKDIVDLESVEKHWVEAVFVGLRYGFQLVPDFEL